MQRIGDLELDQDLVFEQRQWTAQRIGWCLMLAAMVLGLLGLFGTGPLSGATAGGADDGVTVQYERFVRRQGEAELTVSIAPDQVRDGQVELWIAAPWLEVVSVQAIVPEPVEVRAQGDRQVYVFAVDDPSQPVTVSIGYRPQEMGRLPARLGVGDAGDVSFFQFSYP